MWNTIKIIGNCIWSVFCLLGAAFFFSEGDPAYGVLGLVLGASSLWYSYRLWKNRKQGAEEKPSKLKAITEKIMPKNPNKPKAVFQRKTAALKPDSSIIKIMEIGGHLIWGIIVVIMGLYWLMRGVQGEGLITMVFGLFMLGYSFVCWQKKIKGLEKKPSQFSRIFDLIWGIAGVVVTGIGIYFISDGDTDFGAFILIIGLLILAYCYSRWRKSKGLPNLGIKIAEKLASGTTSKIVSKTTVTAPKAAITSVIPKKSKKKFIIIGVAIVFFIIVVMVIWNMSSFNQPDDQKIWTFDFPVSTLRDNDVTLVREEKYFADSSAKYTVVGNTGNTAQENIAVFEHVPRTMAEEFDDLAYNIQPAAVESEDPLVLRFNIDKLEPQESAVIQISSPYGRQRAEQLCAKNNISNCKSHTEEISKDAEEQSRTKYQAKVEPISRVYSETDDFSRKVLAESRKIIAQVETISKKGSGLITQIISVLGKPVAGIKEMVSNIGKEEYQGKYSGQTITYSQDAFPEKIGSLDTLKSVESMSVSESICSDPPPNDLHEAVYHHAYGYDPRTGKPKFMQSGFFVKIAGYNTMDQSVKALKNCEKDLVKYFSEKALINYLEVAPIEGYPCWVAFSESMAGAAGLCAFEQYLITITHKGLYDAGIYSDIILEIINNMVD